MVLRHIPYLALSVGLFAAPVAAQPAGSPSASKPAPASSGATASPSGAPSKPASEPKSAAAATATTNASGAAPKPSAPAAPTAQKPAAPPPSPAQVKKARELWYRGVDAFRNGKYEEAREAFGECYTLMPKTDVLRNLSISEIQSGHYVSAARHLSELLASTTELPATVREEAKTRLAQSEAQIGKLNFNVDVAGATVNVDGAPIGRTPLEGPWYIEPGQHEIIVTKAGYPDETRQIFALAGVAIPVTVSLESLRREQERDAHAVELMGTREGETPQDHGLSTASTITLISTGTLAAVGLVAGIYFTVSANGHDDNADAISDAIGDPELCSPGTMFTQTCEGLWQEQTDAHNDRRRATVSFIGFGVASAATLGYAMWLALRSDDEDKPKAHAVEPGVAFSPSGATLSLHGQF